MPKTRILPYLKSFSFRAGLLIFLGLCLTLITLRILIYYESINDTYQQVRLLIDAHADEMNHDMEHNRITIAQNTINAVLEDAKDKRLYIGLKTAKTVTGNFNDWHLIDSLSKQDRRHPTYHEFLIDKGGSSPLHLFAKVIGYSDTITLVVGYDLKELDHLRRGFFRVLVENIILAFIISMVISFIIIWLLNRHFGTLNDACKRVIAGNIDHRIKVNSNSDQFDQLANNINRMLDWNNALISTVKDSTNAIAHDMRTPLSRLRLKLRKVTENEKISPHLKEEIDESVEMVDKLVEMFDNILKIARAESRVGTNLFENLDLQSITENIIEFYGAILEEKNLHLATSFPSTPAILSGDKQLISQAIVNLLDNACKYTPPEGNITITIDKTPKELTLTVTDSGIGIREDLLERAHERFFRMDKSRHSEGYGLGLSLVHAVAKLHHGQLILENVNPGLKARLIFPNQV